MFTSSLFERSFGVVNIPAGVVCALGNWENRVTVTTAEDSELVTAEVALGSYFENRAIFVGSDSLSYKRLVELVERLCLTVQETKRQLANDPKNALKKYQLVFGMGCGVAWNLEETWKNLI